MKQSLKHLTLAGKPSLTLFALLTLIGVMFATSNTLYQFVDFVDENGLYGPNDPDGTPAQPVSPTGKVFSVQHGMVKGRLRRSQTDKVPDYPGLADYNMLAAIDYDYSASNTDPENTVITGSSGDEWIDGEFETKFMNKYLDALETMIYVNDTPEESKISLGHPTDGSDQFVYQATFVGVLPATDMSSNVGHKGDAREVWLRWSTSNGNNTMAPTVHDHTHTFTWAPGQEVSGATGTTTWVGGTVGMYDQLIGWTWDANAGTSTGGSSTGEEEEPEDGSEDAE